MNPLTASRLRRVGIVMLVILLAAGLYLTAGPARLWLYEGLIVPLWELLWVGYVIASSLPQEIVWALLLGVAFAVSVKSFTWGRPAAPPPPHPPSEEVGPVARWLRRVRYDADGRYVRAYLDRHIAQLLQETLDCRQPAALREFLAAEGDALPPDVRAYLRPTAASAPPRNRILAWLTYLRARWFGLPADGDSQALERAIRFMEDQLEVPYDD